MAKTRHSWEIIDPNRPQTYTPSRTGKPSPRTLRERKKRAKLAAAKRLAQQTSQESASEPSSHPQSQPGFPTPSSPTYSAEDDHFGYWGGFSGSEIGSADENEQDMSGQVHQGSRWFPQQTSYDQHCSSPACMGGPAWQQRSPPLPRLPLVDSGMMTDPWEPVHQTIVSSGPGIVTPTTERGASSIAPTILQNKDVGSVQPNDSSLEPTIVADRRGDGGRRNGNDGPESENFLAESRRVCRRPCLSSKHLSQASLSGVDFL